MTHADLVLRACRWLSKTKRCALVFAEAGKNVLYEEPDALGFYGGARISHVVECKVSRSDFAADAKKTSRLTPTAMGMHRWFMTPPNLVRAEELPDGWGLLYAEDRLVRVVVDAPPHYDDRNVRDELTWLYCATRRWQMGVPWISNEYRFATVDEQKLAREAVSP
jgi:hypothetical protein